METLTNAVAVRTSAMVEEESFIKKSVNKQMQDCLHFESFWTEESLEHLNQTTPLGKKVVVASVGSAIGIRHPSEPTSARMAIFLAIKGFGNARPTPLALKGYQNEIKTEIAKLRAASPYPFSYQVEYGGPEDLLPEKFTHAFGADAPMEAPEGLTALMDSIQFHGPRFSRRSATSLSSQTNDALVTYQRRETPELGGHVRAFEQPTPTIDLSGHGMQGMKGMDGVPDQSLLLRLGIMAFQSMQQGVPNKAMPSGNIAGGRNGALDMPWGEVSDDRATYPFTRRANPEVQEDPIELQRRKMMENMAAKKDGQTSSNVPRGKKLKTAMRCLAKAHDNDAPEKEESGEEEEIGEEEENEEDAESVDETDRGDAVRGKVSKKPGAAPGS